MEQGPIEQNIIKQAIAMGKDLPNRIKNAPELAPDLMLFYSAFWELNSCRQIGSVEGPIPWSAVHLYCNEYEIIDDQRQDMFYHIQMMDSTYAGFRSKET